MVGMAVHVLRIRYLGSLASTSILPIIEMYIQVAHLGDRFQILVTQIKIKLPVLSDKGRDLVSSIFIQITLNV